MSNFNLDNLQSLTPIEFENLVTTLLQQMGFNATTTKISGDGGIDIIALNEQPIVSGKYVIQCKRYAIGNNIGEPAVRDLYGAMMHENANKGILITTSDFTKQAFSFSQNKAIELINGSATLSLFNKYLLVEFEDPSEYRFRHKDLPRSQKELDSRFVFSDYTAHDNETGLIWTRDANLPGKELNWYEACEFVNSLNRRRYASFRNWRLPSITELDDMLVCVKGRWVEKYSYEELGVTVLDVEVNESSFNNLHPDYYWSSADYASNAKEALSLHMLTGRVNHSSKMNFFDYVWPVCSGK